MEASRWLVRRNSLAKFLVYAAIFGLAVTASAQSRLKVYEEHSGVMEFSGEMIARPMLREQLLAQVGAKNADRLLSRARSVVKGMTLRYYRETDEYILRIPFGFDENSLSSYLMGLGGFQYVEPNYICYPVLTPNDPMYGSQWWLPKIEAARAWDRYTGQSSVVAAICDTGCDLGHQDLAGRYVSGYNSADDLPQSLGGQVGNLHPHGTHVAGIVGAIGNNGVGVSGVNWNVSIMPVRVSNQTSGSSSYEFLTRGARWAAENGAKVINTSYSGVSGATIGTTGTYIRSLGALYFYAAGNDGANLSGFDHADVVVVGATDSGDARAGFSAYGLAVDVFAPGVDVLSTIPGNDYAAWSGTSMATPVACGIAGLLWSANPNLTSLEVEQFLSTGCDDLGPPGNDVDWGWGRVNAYRTLAQGVAQIKQNPSTGNYYERVTVPGNASSASNAAQSRSVYGVAGHLATITSAAENQWILANLDGDYLRGHWLGGYQPFGSPEPAGNWRWVTSEPWSYTNWNPGEPNNAGGNEDWLEYWISGTLGGWNDAASTSVSRSTGTGYVVEYPVPAPVMLSGTVSLQDYLGSTSGVPVTVLLKQGSTVIASYSTTTTAGGNWSVVTPWKGNYRILVKASHWLAGFYGVVNLWTSNVPGIVTSLVNGDVNGDNSVDIADYALLSGDWGMGTIGDLNGDGDTDIGDFAILSAGFGRDGDE